MRPCLTILVGLLLLCGSLSAQQTFTKAQLQADFAVLQKAYKTLHPGLYKYADSATIDRYFIDCQALLNHDQSLTDAYLSVMQLTAQLKCGHSYPNFYNQEGAVKALFEQDNCLPFQFRLIDNRMLVTHSIDPAVAVGMEVKTINGTPVATIINTMLPLVRADGANNGKRLRLLEISGQGFEYFDVLFPMLYPRGLPAFRLELANLRTGKPLAVTVQGMRHVVRNEQIRKAYTISTDTVATFRWLNPATAILRINTFAAYNKPFNFGKFYEAAATEFGQKSGQNLIIDIRDNEGGDSWNGKQLIRHLITKPIVINEQQNSWAYVCMDSTLNPYILNKWAYQWRYRTDNEFIKSASGQYRSVNERQPKPLDPNYKPIVARVFLLTSATNSSAALQFAAAMKEHKLATLVGQQTGGNQKGITAGALFFIELPNTKIEVDVPLIGMDYAEAAKRPDAGIMPDVYVKPSLLDALNGVDTELVMVQKLIEKHN
ncbi:S41 family peptidase [Fibrella aquatilis]|uniref:Tail specific protease domain-containing protein n=1 Tax=Fibrella aquatilis TaxID=2817059 RepID=A0A939G4Z2_9BACT|nr:S41 family peptidase [Fibrella aquatilis]MBO0930111.1 hypothetical protein [Fibrella aquatilis]